MAAYIYADLEITDTEAYDAYRQQVPGLVAAHGGRYLVRGGAVEVLKGNRVPLRQLILEFPGMGQLKAFLNSSQYAELTARSHGVSYATMLAIEGV